MRNTKLLPCLLALAFVANFSLATAGAQEKSAVKIGLVDMERIFGEFYRTKLAEAEVEAVKEVIKGEVEQRKSAHQKIITELEPLIKKMQDPTLSEAVRKKAQEAAKVKDDERKVLDAEMQEYSERRRRQLVEQVEKSKAELLNEISKKINEISTADGFDAVFDRSGLSERGFPFVVFVKDATDLSEKIIQNLNANAPATGAAPAPAAE